MALTSSQKSAIKALIVGDNALNSYPNNSDGNFEIAKLLNVEANPAYWVWKTNVSRSDIYNETSDTASVWNWTTYKNQSATEQNAWTQMFLNDHANFSKVNLRSGVAAIFSGSAQANSQRDHIFATSRRKATVAEKTCAVAVTSPPANTGNDGIANNRGLTTNPDVPTLEGNVSYVDVEEARNS